MSRDNNESSKAWDPAVILEEVEAFLRGNSGSSEAVEPSQSETIVTEHAENQAITVLVFSILDSINNPLVSTENFATTIPLIDTIRRYQEVREELQIATSARETVESQTLDQNLQALNAQLTDLAVALGTQCAAVNQIRGELGALAEGEIFPTLSQVDWYLLVRKALLHQARVMSDVAYQAVTDLHNNELETRDRALAILHSLVERLANSTVLVKSFINIVVESGIREDGYERSLSEILTWYVELQQMLLRVWKAHKEVSMLIGRGYGPVQHATVLQYLTDNYPQTHDPVPSPELRQQGIRDGAYARLLVAGNYGLYYDEELGDVILSIGQRLISLPLNYFVYPSEDVLAFLQTAIDELQLALKAQTNHPIQLDPKGEAQLFRIGQQLHVRGKAPAWFDLLFSQMLPVGARQDASP